MDLAGRLTLAELKVEVGVQRDLHARALGDRFAEALRGPDPGFAPVIEAGLTFHIDRRLAFKAGCDPDQGKVGPVLGHRLAVRVPHVPLGDRQGVPDHDPSGVGRPGCLDDQGPGFVSPAERGGYPARGETESPGGPVEQRSEGAG